MVWVSIKKSQPELGKSIITRCPGKPGDCFEDWREWNELIPTFLPRITHWWDGIFDMNEAVEEWKKNVQNK